MESITKAVEEQSIVLSWLHYEQDETFTRYIKELLKGNRMPSDTNWEINPIGEVEVDIIYVPTYGYMAQTHGISYEGATVVAEKCKVFLIEAKAGNEVRRIVTLTDQFSVKDDGTPKVYGRYLLT